MAVDPTTGARTDILDGCSMRPRVSPDGKLLAFEREDALWVLGLDPNAEPRKIVELGGSSLGSPPVWSPDGKQIVISLAARASGTASQHRRHGLGGIARSRPKT